jgi:hypothetical protein
MDIFEAIRVFYTPRMMTWSHFLSPREKQQHEAAWQQRQEAEKVCECPETYIPFTAREGRAVALAAIELVDVGVEERYQYLPHIILKNLAQAVPGALQGLYPRLIERNLFWGDGVLYREADAGTRDLLLDFLENEVQGDLEYQDVLWPGSEMRRSRRGSMPGARGRQHGMPSAATPCRSTPGVRGGNSAEKESGATCVFRRVTT